MKHYSWESSFLEIFETCIERYRAGSKNPDELYMPDEMAFISSIGYKPREFFDFIEETQDLTTVVYNEWKTSIWGMWEEHNNCFLNLEAK
mgnify:CR=1 FL=1